MVKSRPANPYPKSNHQLNLPGTNPSSVLLLMARSRTDESAEKPTFSVIYPLGGAGKTLPVTNQAVDKTIAERVEAVGGTMTTAGKPTVLLAVHCFLRVHLNLKPW